MLTQIHKYLVHRNGVLNDLQLRGQEFLAGWPIFNSSLFAILERAADNGDSYAAAVCAAALRAAGEHHDCKMAFHYATKSAIEFFPPGLAELSYCYQYGCGTEVALDSALQLADSAAWRGYGSAACNLAVQYAEGEPFGKDASKAMEYANLAQRSGEAYGAYLLGLWYEEGLLISKSLVLARIWYRRAALQGSGLACVKLASAYAKGELGLPANMEKSRVFAQLIDHMNSP